MRNRILDEHVDQQTSIIFNCDELERFNSGVLACKRDTPIERLLCLGLSKHSEVSEMIANPSAVYIHFLLAAS